MHHNRDQNYYPTISDYYKNPIYYGYLLYSPTTQYIGNKKYTLQKAIDFTKVNSAWQIPYKNVIHYHYKSKINNIIDRGYFCRLIETDAVFIKNIMDDILKDRKRPAESASNSNGDEYTRYFREIDFNGYLNEPVFRSQMRFKAWSINHLADDLKNTWITKPYVYMRTHMKNPYVYQNLVSLNSDSLYDSAINSIRPTLPALFITEANELCYIEMLTTKSRKKFPIPNNMMGYYQLLNLNGEVVIPKEIICNYSFRKQTASSIFDINYLFIYEKDDGKKWCLITNNNLVPMYDIEFDTQSISEGATLVVTPKITGCGQLTLADYWYDPYLLNEEHFYTNYSYYGAVAYVGKLFPEFNEDATAYNYDQLEFLKERRPYNLNKDATDVPEFIQSIIDTDKMEDTRQIVCQETSTGAALDIVAEYKYPKLNKIYYYDNTTKQRAFRYDPASKENEAIVQIASICGLSPTESLLDLSSYVLSSTNTPFLTSYETYANLKEAIDIGPLWFFWGTSAATDTGPWSTSYPVNETLLLSKLEVLSTSSAGDIIAQSQENDPDTGEASLTDDIMTIRVTMETQKLQYMIKKGIVVEENTTTGEKYFVKYDVNIVVAPRVGLYSGDNQLITSFKVRRYTGVNFDTLTESDLITLYNGYESKTTVTKYENSKNYFRFLYYLDSYTEIKDSEYTNNYRIYSENVKIYSRVKESITIRKTIAPGIIYDRGEWEYPGYTWKYNPAEETQAFESKSIKKDFDYIKPLYYYTNTLTELTNTYNQPNIIAKTSLDRLKTISKGFVNSCTSMGEANSRQYGFNEIIQKGIPTTAPDKIFSHGMLIGKNFYTFKQQPCYNGRIPSDNPYAPSETELYTDPQSDATKAYPRLNNSVHSTTKLFDIEQVDTDIKDNTGKEILNKKLITTNWDFSLEPPKSLVHPIPTQFTLIGPCYHSPVQAAAFKQFTSTITTGGGYPYYGGSVNLYTDDLMMIYYVPSDPILTESDVYTIGSARTLDLHFKGINRNLGLTNAERFKVLTEASNFSGSIDLINEDDPETPTTFPDSRLLRFSTNARFGTYRLKIKDDLEITKNPKTGESVLRIDQSPLIKIWPRTLPIRYQQDINGIFQKVSDWKLGFLPAPKSNYHLRFFRKEEQTELLDLDKPFDPQYSIMRIKKIESTKTGDNDLDEVSMEVSFWSVAYNGSPYIPKKLSKKYEMVVEFNGVGSYPYYWYIINTDQTSNVALLLPLVENGVINKKKRKLATLTTAGKFKLCVTDGAGIFYTSSEIEIE